MCCCSFLDPCCLFCLCFPFSISLSWYVFMLLAIDLSLSLSSFSFARSGFAGSDLRTRERERVGGIGRVCLSFFCRPHTLFPLRTNAFSHMPSFLLIHRRSEHSLLSERGLLTAVFQAYHRDFERKVSKGWVTVRARLPLTAFALWI